MKSLKEQYNNKKNINKKVVSENAGQGLRNLLGVKQRVIADMQALEILLSRLRMHLPPGSKSRKEIEEIIKTGKEFKQDDSFGSSLKEFIRKNPTGAGAGIGGLFGIGCAMLGIPGPAILGLLGTGATVASGLIMKVKKDPLSRMIVFAENLKESYDDIFREIIVQLGGPDEVLKKFKDDQTIKDCFDEISKNDPSKVKEMESDFQKSIRGALSKKFSSKIAFAEIQNIKIGSLFEILNLLESSQRESRRLRMQIKNATKAIGNNKQENQDSQLSLPAPPDIVDILDLENFILKRNGTDPEKQKLSPEQRSQSFGQALKKLNFEEDQFREFSEFLIDNDFI